MDLIENVGDGSLDHTWIPIAARQVSSPRGSLSVRQNCSIVSGDNGVDDGSHGPIVDVCIRFFLRNDVVEREDFPLMLRSNPVDHIFLRDPLLGRIC